MYDSLISGYTESNSSVTHQLSTVNIGGDLTMKAGGSLNSYWLELAQFNFLMPRFIAN